MRTKIAKVVSCVLVIALVGVLGLPGVSFGKSKGEGISTQDVVYVPADQWESDDGTATAKVLPAVSSHTLHSADDEDWMKFTIDETGTPVAFDTQITGGNDDFDTRLWLYMLEDDGSLTFIDEHDDHAFWDAYSQDMLVYLDPGTYMLRMKGYTGFETPDEVAGEAGSYDLYWNVGFTRRVYGANRYDTAIEVSKMMYQQATVSVDWDFGLAGLVIASGTNPADGIAGSLLASMLDSPLLLSGPTGLSAATCAEIERALMPVLFQGDPLTIYILGGTNAVPAVVETQIGALPAVAAALSSDQLEIVRIAGDNRYDTAAQIAVEYWDTVGSSTTAYLVNGNAWADALAVAAPAVYDGRVILSSRVDTIPVETLDAMDTIGITNVVVVGGEGVINADVYADLEAMFGESSVERVWGTTRYQTAYEVAVHAVDSVGLTSEDFVLVSGEKFPDAMIAGPMTYMYTSEWGTYGPILLTPGASLAPEVTDFIDDYGFPGYIIYVVGGPTAISNAALAELNELRLPPR